MYSHVINIDIFEDSNDYLHREGRVGEKGDVFSLVDDKEEKIIKSHEKNFKINISEKHIYKGNAEG